MGKSTINIYGMVNFNSYFDLTRPAMAHDFGMIQVFHPSIEGGAMLTHALLART